MIAPDWRGYGLTELPRDRQLLVPRLPGRPRLPARSLRRRRAGGPGGPQHGRQRRDALCRRAAASASAGWSTSKASAWPATRPSQAPGRYAKWMDELKALAPRRAGAQVLRLASTASRARLMKTNSGCRRTRPTGWPGTGRAQERRRPLAHPGRRRRTRSPTPTCSASTRCWRSTRRIRAPVLAVEASDDSLGQWWQGRYTLAEYHERLKSVSDARIAPRRGRRPHAAPRPARRGRATDRGIHSRLDRRPLREFIRAQREIREIFWLGCASCKALRNNTCRRRAPTP